MDRGGHDESHVVGAHEPMSKTEMAVLRSCAHGAVGTTELLDAFFTRCLAEVPVERLKSPAGFFRVATPEVTAYDIVACVRCCPSLDHAGTVLVELADVRFSRKHGDHGVDATPLGLMGVCAGLRGHVSLSNISPAALSSRTPATVRTLPLG